MYDKEKLEIIYSEMPDDELIAMLAVDKEEYEEIVYDLIWAEAKKRGIDKIKVDKKVQERIEKYTGIKGWLLLFVIGVFVSSLLYIPLAILSISDYDPPWSFIFTITSICINGVYGLFTFYQLITKNKKAPFHAMMWIILGLFLVFFEGMVLGFPSEKIKQLFFNFIYSLIWLLYLSLSKRVTATYSDNKGGGSLFNTEEGTEELK